MCLGMCVCLLDLHAALRMQQTITWRVCAAMHIMQLMQTNNYTCLQTERQTWAQLFTSVNRVLTAKYMRDFILYVGICEEGFRHGDRQKQL